MGRRDRKAAKLDRMTRASVEVKCDDKTFYFTPLALNEMSQLERWVREQPYRLVPAKLKAMGLDIESDSPIVEKMIQQAETQCQDKQYIAEQLESIAGITQGILLGFRVRHPDMTEEVLSDIISIVGFENLQNTLEETSHLDADEAGNSEGAKQ